MAQLIEPDEIDRRFSWPPGRAAKLARQRRLPHMLLPDGSIRFDGDELDKMILRVQLTPGPGKPRGAVHAD